MISIDNVSQIYVTAGSLLDPRHGRDGGGPGDGPQLVPARPGARHQGAPCRHAQRGLPQGRDRHAQTGGAELQCLSNPLYNQSVII